MRADERGLRVAAVRGCPPPVRVTEGRRPAPVPGASRPPEQETEAAQGSSFRGQYTIYKPVRNGSGGALRFELNRRTGAVFVEAARQVAQELRRFEWEKKIVMKWGLADIGEALAVLERRQNEAKLFHQTPKGNTVLELKYQADRRPPNYFVTISRQRADTKEVDRLGISVSPGEAAVLSALLRRAAVEIAGWGGE